jgi:hypothetical protein
VTDQTTGRADERLAGLVRLARVMADTRSLPELAERVCEEARFALGARNVSLSRLEPERGLVRTIVNVGELAPGDERYPVDETYMVADFPLLGSMVDEAQPWRVQVDDPGTDFAERELLARMGAASAIAAPLLAEGRVWGELFATRSAGDTPFDDDDLAFAQAFAGMVSAGLAQVEHLAAGREMLASVPRIRQVDHPVGELLLNRQVPLLRHGHRAVVFGIAHALAEERIRSELRPLWLNGWGRQPLSELKCRHCPGLAIGLRYKFKAVMRHAHPTGFGTGLWAEIDREARLLEND